jgi:ketosteroid isomerase-like protein
MTAKETVHTYYGTLASGDFDGAARVFADDIVWWILPASPLAGLYEGKSAVLQMLAEKEKLYDSSAPRRIELLNVIAEDNRCAAEVRLTRRTVAGSEYKNYYHYLFECRDNRIAGVKEYFDTLHAQRVLFDGAA